MQRITSEATDSLLQWALTEQMNAFQKAGYHQAAPQRSAEVRLAARVTNSRIKSQTTREHHVTFLALGYHLFGYLAWIGSALWRLRLL
jgi:hypothetical protein